MSTRRRHLAVGMAILWLGCEASSRACPETTTALVTTAQLKRPAANVQIPSTPMRRLRPISPAAGVVTSSHVLFRWAPALDGGRLELARDPGFAVIARAVDVDGGEHALASLGRGTWFWRVVDWNGAASALRRLRVDPRTSRQVRQSNVIGSDFNGDGLDDVPLIRAVYLGGPIVHPIPPERRPFLDQGALAGCSLMHHAQAPEPLCWESDHPRSLGDVNGDGSDDLGAFQLLFWGWGSGAGERWTAAHRLDASVAAIGDVNTDGFADAVDAEGQIHLGGPDGLSKALGMQLPPVSSARLAGGADFNGDGHHDVVVLSDDVGLIIYLGSPSGISASAKHRIVLPLPPGAAHRLVRMGDLDGDGLADIVGGFVVEEEVSPYPGKKPQTWKRPALWFVPGTPDVSSAAVRHQARFPVFQVEEDEHLKGNLSFDIDYRVGAGGGACLRALDTGMAHQEVMTVTLESSGFRFVPVRRFRGHRFPDRITVSGDTNGDGMDDIVVWCFDPHGILCASLIPGTVEPPDVLVGTHLEWDLSLFYHPGPVLTRLSLPEDRLSEHRAEQPSPDDEASGDE